MTTHSLIGLTANGTAKAVICFTPFSFPLISGKASNVGDSDLPGSTFGIAPFYTFADLKWKNKILLYEEFVDIKDRKWVWIQDSCARVIQYCDIHKVERLAKCDDRELITIELQEELRSYFKKFLPDEDERTFTLALELLVVGMLLQSDIDDDYRHTIPEFNKRMVRMVFRAKYGTRISVLEARIASDEKELQGKHQAQGEKFVSLTQEKEHDPDLAPAEKARVFMNALRSRNEMGRLVTWQKDFEAREYSGLEHLIEKDLIFKKSDRETAEAFFEDHRWVSVADILVMLDHCVEYFVNSLGESPKKFDPFWHVKRGRIISFFFAHYERIAADIDEGGSTDFLSLFAGDGEE